MSNNWKGKVVLVTGASSGIGRALALEFARRGAAVGLIARSGDKLAEVAAEIVGAGGDALPLQADVTNTAEVESVVARAIERWAKIDVLVANAGTTTTTSATMLSASEANKVISVNVIGVINCVAAVLPSMLAKKGGHLVAISSLASYRGMPKSGAYSASKAAVSTFFESLRVDLRATGIAVTTIHPGFIRTPLTAGRKRKLPFLMEVEPAGRLIIRAIEKRARTFAFPWQLANIVLLIKHLPDAVYDRLAAHTNFRE